MASLFQEEKTKRKIETLHRKEEEESVKMLSQKYRIPYADLSKFPVELDAVRVIPEEKARKGNLAVSQITERHLIIGVLNPEKEETRSLLKHLEEEGYTYELFLVSRSSLTHTWEFYRKVPEMHLFETGAVRVSNEKLASIKKEITSFEDITRRVEETLRGRVTNVLEVILAGALALDASDIHIEPRKEKIRLRLRIDGMLHDVLFIPLKLYTLLMSRIKLVSELKLNIRDRAQDGRFTIKIDTTDVEVRVSTLPSPNGENVVLRILNPNTFQITLEGLGMQPWIHEIMEKELRKPNGMILTTGPTGSGKTTTLYAFVKNKHTSDIKIITIEDPIEYHLSGVEQTQVNPEKGYTFANGLSSIVRQDPDIILVGEIRDFETAQTAMHAALTGHLVFSTLHTNDAAGTIPRLIDLGVKPAIIAPAINVSMAQRLLRKLCPSCRITTRLNAKEKKQLEQELNNFPKGVKIPEAKEWSIFKASPQGCIHCKAMGYKGRIGIFEIILIDAEIERLILKEPSEFEIKKEAIRQRQITMRQDGILKVLKGITDFAELERVVGS